MQIKPPQSRHTEESEKRGDSTTSDPEKRETGYQSTDSVEQHKGERLEYLKTIGADSVLTESELKEAADDDNKRKTLMDLVAAGELFGASNEAIQKAKDKYLDDATPGGVEKIKFDLFAESQKIPAEEARTAGLKDVKALLTLKANLELLGESDSGTILSNPEIYKQIKVKGVDNVLAETAIQNLGLSENAKGLSLKQILNGAANAQKKGQDASKAEYWDKIKKGQAHGAADHARRKGNAEHTPGQHDRGVGKPADNRERGKFIEEPLHHAKTVGTHHTGESALNPLTRKKDSESNHANIPPQQHHDSSKNNETKHTSTERNWPGPITGSHHKKESTNAGGGSHGTPTGNSTQGSDSTNSPTQGSNPRGGAANDYSNQPGANQQTGIGVSAATGQEAHAGAVNTVTGVHHGLDNSTTFYWTRSGGGDGKDGNYYTIYDGRGGWMVFNQDTQELVNQGEGDPPADSIVGQSTQDDDQTDDVMTFPTSDDDNDENSSSEGMPIDPMIGNFSDSDGILEPWEIGVHISRTNQLIHTAGNSSGKAPIVGRKGEPNDGITDPGSDLESHRVGGSKKFRRSEGYTDGAPEDTGGHKPVSSKDQPKQPSHAKRQSSIHRTRRSGR